MKKLAAVRTTLLSTSLFVSANLAGSVTAHAQAGAGGTTGAATPAAASGQSGAKKTSSKKGPTSGKGLAASAADDRDVAPTTPPPSSSPMAELKKANADLDRALKKKHPAWSPEAEAQKAEVRQLIGAFLDYRELARRALAKHWDTLTPAKQREFVATLRELVERSYLGQLRGDPNYTIKYTREEKNGPEATVWATLSTVARGKKVNLALEYRLIHKERWVVYDLVTDEQSMLENYRAEFNKIINKDGFDALLKRMKAKLAEKAKDE